MWNKEHAKAYRQFYYLDHKQEMRASDRRNFNLRRDRKRALLDDAYGSGCMRCGAVNELAMHRLDTMPHKKFAAMSIDELEDIIENHKDDYVRLCHSCHKKIHWEIERELALPTSI